MSRYFWTIENFSCKKFGTFQSPGFQSFKLLVDPFASSECISIEVKVCEGIFNAYSNFSIAFLDSEGSPQLWREKKSISNTQSFRFNDIKRDVIFGPKRNKFLPNDILIVQCIVWKTREQLLNPTTMQCNCSRVEFYTEVIEKRWDISVRSSSNDHHIVTVTPEEAISLLTSRGDKLQIRLFFDETFRVTLISSFRKVQVKCIISVLDAKGGIIQFTNEEHDFHQRNEEWTFSIPAENILRHRNQFLYRDTLSLVFVCNLTRHNVTHRDSTIEGIFVNNSHPNVVLPLAQTTDTNSDESRNKKPKLSCNTLSQSLMGILEEGFMSDFSFRVQDKTFPVHKIILSARSPVFRAMFTADMKEKESGSVDIPDVEADTFQRVLDFIYIDTVEDDMQWESASKLYSVADKYALEPLKQKCSQLLKTMFHVSSVLDILLISDTHQDNELKSAALDFIARNDKLIVGTDIWGRFVMENPMVALDALQKLYAKKMNC